MNAPSPSLRTAATLILLVFLLLLILTNTRIAAEGVRQALDLCTQTLLPSLFPFLILSELLIAFRVTDKPAKWLKKPFAALFGLSEGGTSALLLGALGGFPVGASAAVTLCERGELSESELHRLLLFSNNPSVGFLIGAVGCSLFGNQRAGIALFLIVWCAAAAVGILWRFVCGAPQGICPLPVNGGKKSPFFQTFTKTVSKGLFAMLQVFSFVLFFSCISACLLHVLARLPLPDTVRVLLCGIPELTVGIHTAVSSLPAYTAFRLTAFFSGFAGLCVCLQLFSVSEDHSPPILPYLFSKLMQGTLSLLLTELYLRICKPQLCITNSISTFSPNALEQKSTVCILLLFPLLLLFTALLDRKRKTVSPPR